MWPDVQACRPSVAFKPLHSFALLCEDPKKTISAEVESNLDFQLRGACSPPMLNMVLLMGVDT